MKLYLRFLLIALLASFGAYEAGAQFSRAPYVPGEMLVKLKPALENGFYSRTNTSKQESLYKSEWTRVALPKGTSVESARTGYLNDPAVEAAQPNFYYYLAVDPDDTHFGSLWGMSKISAPLAWDTETGDSNTIVAVIDTGIKYTHEDLAANMWTNPLEIPGNNTDDDSNGLIDDVYGYDFFFDDSDPDDEFNHGTHVAGTIGAVGNNALGVVGVNWNVKIIAVKIYDATGLGTTSAMLISAYNYVTALKLRGENIRVTNNSYSGCDEACGYDQATKDALDAMGDAGILNVFAAGNDARNVETTPAYPASYNSASVLSVAASTSTDTRSGFSNFGDVSVDLAAPGSGILSAVINGTGYGNSSGTSMASPHVAGAAALLSSHNPALNNASIKATLMNTVDPLANWNGVVRTGGRLNVASALANQTVCDIALSPQSQFVFPEGGDFSIDVNVPDGCDYNVKKDAALFFGTLNSPATGTGNSTVTYSISGNSDLERGGKILIGDKEFQVTQSGSQAFPHRGFIDFEGDGRTDFTAIQNVGGQMIWHTLGSGGYQGFSFGLFADDIPIPGHYDGDLINDLAVWRRSTGTFYVYLSATGGVQVVNFGVDGDNPLVTQDFDGDGINDFAVVRKQNGKLIWYVLRSTDGQAWIFQFGNDTDRPLRGDYDGDGKADPAVYQPQAGSPSSTFFVLRSSDQAVSATTFGLSGIDEPVPNDYDGDGKTDYAVWRTTDGVWHLLRSSDGAYVPFHFGSPGDLPTPGDYDGDGRTDFSIWRPGANGGQAYFYVFSVLSGFNVVAWGNDSMLVPAEILRTP